MTDNLIFMTHRAHDLLHNCEDRVLREHGLTSEQYEVLRAVKHLPEPVRPTDIARRLTKSVNSISMITDRMVKAGLLRTTRDKVDRRKVRLTTTDQADAKFIPAQQAIREFNDRILGSLQPNDKHLLSVVLSNMILLGDEILKVK